MHKTKYPILLMASLIILWGCDGLINIDIDNSDETIIDIDQSLVNEINPTLTLNQANITTDNLTINPHFVAPAHDDFGKYIQAFSPQTGKMDLHPNAKTEEVRIGDIIALEPSELVPDGYLGTVNSITNGEDNTEIILKNATLEDVFQEGSFEIRIPIKESTASAASLTIGDGFRLVGKDELSERNIQTKAEAELLVVEIEEKVVLFDEDGNQGTTYDQAWIDGFVGFTLDAVVEVEVDWTLALKYAMAKLEGTETIDIGFNVGGSLSKDIEIDPIKMFSFDTVAIVLGVPVTFGVDVYFIAGAKFVITASSSMSVNQSGRITVGSEYTGNQWRTINTVDFDFEYEAPTLDVGASAKAWAGSSVFGSIYGVEGPFFNIAPYAEIGIDSGLDWDLHAGVDAEVGVYVEKFGWEIVDYSTDKFDLFAPYLVASGSLAPQYELSVTEDTGGSVAISPPTGPYDSGTTVQLTATPDADYTFSGWTGDTSSSSNPISITMDSDKSITANFDYDPPSYTLGTFRDGDGSISRSPNQSSYLSGTVVTLTANPASGWSFSHWSGDANSTSRTTTVTMDSAKTVTANFTEDPPEVYSLTVNAGAGGSTNPSGTSTRNAGTVVTISAIADSDYSFSHWTGQVQNTSSQTTTVTMTSDQTVTAYFTAIPPSSFTLTVNSSTGGTTSPSGTSTRNPGEVVSLTATPDSGYTFANWSGDISGSSQNTTITMNANKSVTANFTPEAAPPPASAALYLFWSTNGQAYDLVSNTWSAISNLTEPIREYGIAENSGYVYLFGGSIGSGGGAFNTTYRYDPSADSYVSMTPMPADRRWLRAVAAGDDIYVVGGSPDPVASKLAWKYSPAADEFTAIDSMNTARSNFAIAYANGDVFVFGGESNGWPVSTAERYDVSSNSWSFISAPPDYPDRRYIDAVSYEGHIYLFGGEGWTAGPTGSTFDLVQRYDPQTDSYETLTSMPEPAIGPHCLLVGSLVYVIIGQHMYIYDILNDEWTTSTDLSSSMSYQGAAAVIP